MLCRHVGRGTGSLYLPRIAFIVLVDCLLFSCRRAFREPRWLPDEIVAAVSGFFFSLEIFFFPGGEGFVAALETVLCVYCRPPVHSGRRTPGQQHPPGEG